MLTHYYRVSKRRLILLILVTVTLTWGLLFLSNAATSIFTSVTGRSKPIKGEPLSFNLPWYRQPHKPFLTNGTTYAWTKKQHNNNSTTWDMIMFAKETVRLALGQHIEGIPGSSLTTREQADQFRSQVKCWTQQQASWQYRAIPSSSLLSHFQDPLYGRCDRSWRKQHHGSSFPIPPRPATQYRWQPPAHCPLLSEVIRSEQWCEIIDGRHTLIVGDLVQYQLHDLLLDALRDGPSVCYGELNCKDHTLCPRPKKARLRYIRNDLLSNTARVNLADGKPTTNVIEWPFLGIRPLTSFKIILLNRSPILEDDATFVQQLAITMSEIRRKQPDALILYRSSFIGHPYCDEAEGPLHTTENMKTNDNNDNDDAKELDDQLGAVYRQQLPFGWSEYHRRNRLAQAIVEEAGGVYLDMAYSLDQRPDGHVGGSDCLRYCMPGPLDAWALLFYNIFLALGTPLRSL